MKKAPKSLRLHIGLFGRTNVGKSSFLNLVANQDVAITSPVPGTTTDVVEKVMELLPLGPVVFLDTAGIDDTSSISDLRIKKTKNIFDRADIILLLIEADIWGKYEDAVLQEAEKRKTPFIIVVNKTDLKSPSLEFANKLKGKTDRVILCSSTDFDNRDTYVNELKKYAELAGFKRNVGTHTMRKTFGYRIYQATNNLATVQKLLNHSNSGHTLRYIGIEAEELDDAIMGI